MTYTLFCCFLL